MHSSAYIDEPTEAADLSKARYAPLKSAASAAVYSDPIPTAAPASITPVQKLRAEGRTRRAVVYGCEVRFQRLSTGSRVNPVWGTFWKETYESDAEAQAAADIWARSVKINPPGFMRNV